MNVSDVMEGIAARLRTIPDLVVYDGPAGNTVTPSAEVSFPDEITYDDTMGPGTARADFMVLVLVAPVAAQAAPETLSGFLNSQGPTSVKEAVESGRTLGGAADSARVVSARPLGITSAGVEYVAAEFTVNVIT